jgi:hypothetical protein
MQVIVPLIVGHVTSRMDLDTLQFIISSSNSLCVGECVSVCVCGLVDGVADITIQGTKASRFLLITPRGKSFGSTTITVTVYDVTQASAKSSFVLNILRLSPFFDDYPPTNTFKDMKTIAGTPTFPYRFLVGHEDADLVASLKIEASSLNVEVIPDNCVSNSAPFGSHCVTDNTKFMNIGGIYVNISKTQIPASRGGFSSNAREVVVIVRPQGTASADHGVTQGRIKTFVYSRPSVDKFCAYDVQPADTLTSIANKLGMHWLTLFLMNNHTLTHPDTVPPGLRIAIGRPYVVQPGDSLYSIATRFGTTWQHIMTTNSGNLLEAQSIFEGQLLCLAPDLAFVACRGR